MDKKFTRNMTKISRKAFRGATVEIHSAKDAVIYLNNELLTRNVRSIIEKFAKGRDIKVIQKMLSEGLMENHEGAVKESVERRVRGWLNPKSVHSIKKEDAIEIAFILGLTFEEADEFVALISEEKFHWRNVEEIIYIYGLQHGLTFRECKELYQTPEIQDAVSGIKDPKTLDEIDENDYTEFVRDDIEQIESVEELKTYIQDNYKRLGNLHNTAYEMFVEMLGKLESPSQSEEDLELFGKSDQTDKRNDDLAKKMYKKFTIRDILLDNLYCSKEVIKIKKKNKDDEDKYTKVSFISKEQKATLNKIQKIIAANWPDEIGISKMKKREWDVSRKSLILLFLATDGDYEEDSFYYEVPEDEVFEDTLERMNDMLFFSGYASLDPRNPFDWLIIYCIYVGDLLDIDPKMQDILKELFSKEDE